MKNMFLFISGAEIFIILVIVVMLFGADKLPELARGLGKGMQQLKSATNEVKKEITEGAKKQGIDTNLADDIQKEVKNIKNKVKDNIDDLTGPIKRNL
jgi:sec-independent protein translocase protein TatA